MQDNAKLSPSQVKLYLELPDGFRDRWLNAGADVHVFDVSPEYLKDRVVYELRQFGLGEFLDDKNAYRFRKSLAALVDLCMWLTEHAQLERAVDFHARWLSSLSRSPSLTTCRAIGKGEKPSSSFRPSVGNRFRRKPRARLAE